MTRSIIRAWIATLVISLAYAGSTLAAPDAVLNLDMPSGQTLDIRRYGDSGKSTLLWLPSERGFRAELDVQARKLARLGHDLWLADFHEAYFLQPDRDSIGKIPIDDVIALIDTATADNDAGLVLVSGGRGAQLALIAAREWQLGNPGKNRVEGIVLLHAYLYEARPKAGADARFLPIARATNLPVYLLDTQYSTKSMRAGQLAAALGEGGSQVYSEVLKGVQGGFFARDDDELSAADKAAKRDFAQTLNRAISLLERTRSPEFAAASKLDTRRLSSGHRKSSALNPVEMPIPAPRLSLTSYREGPYSLQAQSGRIALVNFWASWCKPCVDEIPSLHRLKSRIRDPAFDIVTVNVGEDRARIGDFIEKVPIAFPVLMDIDHTAARDWKIYVYPSSYLVDREGKIRYAYLGALEWDSPENIKIIEGLLGSR